ncbi:MAG: IPExxxVDY family protein [Taibaiella sp.]|nr:IPExxxVDY family protein [Taibaiella sp.]
MAAKSKKLSINDMEEDFFSETAMIGIICALPAYHLCWKINEYFDFNFECDPELTLPFCRSDITSYFPVFEYKLPNSNHSYLLYKVKNEQASLLQSSHKGTWLSKLDFIWLIKTGQPEYEARYIIDKLKQINWITMSHEIDSQEIKNIENLIV